MKKEIIYSDKAPAPIGPYSQAVKAGNQLYVSGQIPLIESTGELVSGNIKNETEQVMKNIRFILDEARLNFSDVVKCSIFVKNMNDFFLINEVYGNYFDERQPARETVEVSKLPKNVNVEISCIAIFPTN